MSLKKQFLLMWLIIVHDNGKTVGVATYKKNCVGRVADKNRWISNEEWLEKLKTNEMYRELN